jgi:3-isopropylmalate dehydratase small subunit
MISLIYAYPAPASYLIHADFIEATGQLCLEYTNPDFCDEVKRSFNIVVARKRFGCGSSRMEAVMILLSKISLLLISCLH